MKGEGNIKVFCRFRPFNSKELDNNPTRLHRISKDTQLIIKDHKSQQLSFIYDHLFDMQSTQEEIYEKIANPILNNILDGFNGTIMAYGQTSSGKTHTMQGYDLSDKDNRGIMPRIIQNLFAAIEKSPENVEFKLKVAIFELYMEKIRDLLDTSKNDLKIRESKQGYYIENLTEVYVGEKLELFRLISIGQKNRITCATNMNEHSSRSHLIFLLTLNQTSQPDGASKTSKLFLIDLAGSQKISKTGAQGKVLQQAKKINLSLTNLGKVIKSLAEKGEKGGHIPYRDSKLTRILKDSLGGNSKTTLIVTCSPHQIHLPQTISTLRFGQNAQKVKNKPKINRELTVQQLQKIIQKYELEIKEKNSHIKFLQEFITTTLKIDPPQFIPQSLFLPKPQQIQKAQLQLEQQSSFSLSSSPSKMVFSSLPAFNEQAEQRIKILEKQLSIQQDTLKVQMQKFYKLKKDYHDLHENLTSILTENMDLKQQLQEKQRKSIFSQKNISNNVILIRIIFADILSFLQQETQYYLVNNLHQHHWYEKIIEEGVDCNDFWQKQKQSMQKQLQNIQNQSLRQQTQSQINQQSAQSSAIQNQKKIILQQQKIQKDNQKILQLQQILEEYKKMVAHQAHWKAQCQLYERNLRRKQEDILKLQREVQKLQELMEQMYIYDEIDDAISVKSNNRIVKPLKGGGFIR